MQTLRFRRIVFVLVVAGIGCARPLLLTAQSAPQSNGDGTAVSISYLADSVNNPTNYSSSRAPMASSGMVAVSPTPKRETGVDWVHLARGSFTFLAVENGFRCATEQGTRDGFSGPFIPGYLNSVGDLHGWSDGDPFLVNYIGHPMQGAVSGYIWQHNDRAYRTVEFGRNSRYWKGKLRGAAFSYLYSVQFEIGALSEAALGNIQGLYPQQGFVDQVVTPAVGFGWTIAEDSIDRYIVRAIEAHVANPYFRLLARGALNPSRSMANVMMGQLPWHRDDRPGVFTPYPDAAAVRSFMEQATAKTQVRSPSGVAPFEFTVEPIFKQYFGTDAKGSCAGGGSSAAIRVGDQWQVVVAVNGCKILDLPANLSGDSLTYMVGPRWTSNPSGRWTPHAQFLVGGTKLTQERLDPETRDEVIAELYPKRLGNAQHPLYTRQYETNGFAIAAGTGVDYKINNALAFRVASLDYSHSWNNELNGINYSNGLQFTTGLVLRMGTW